jgi:spore maturation protein SpmB
MTTEPVKVRQTLFDIFIVGARKGWNIASGTTVPNVLMAFVITHILNLTGILALIGKIFGPFMAIFGLPGEAVTLMLTSWLSMGGGCGMAAKFYADGIFTIEHLAIVFPSIFLMGAQVQYMGRALGTAGVKSHYYGVMIGLSVLNAFLSMLLMRFLITFAV